MLISTKGRYALRVMIDLAEHQTDGYIPLKEVAQRQDILLNDNWKFRFSHQVQKGSGNKSRSAPYLEYTGCFVRKDRL